LNRSLQEQGVEERTTGAAAAFKNSMAGFRNTFVAAGRPSQGGAAVGAITGATAEQLLSALYQRMQVPIAGAIPHGVPVAPATAIPPQPLFDRADLALPAPPVARGGIAGNGMFTAPRAGGTAGTPVQFAAIDPLLASINEVSGSTRWRSRAQRIGHRAAISDAEAQLRAHVSPSGPPSRSTSW
jgi:hypothetical protein